MPFKAALRDAAGRKCPYCRQVMQLRGGGHLPRADREGLRPSQDHVTPRAQGGGDGTLTVCRRCNIDKGNLSLAQWHKALTDSQDPRADAVAWLLAGERWRAHTFTGARPNPPPFEFPEDDLPWDKTAL